MKIFSLKYEDLPKYTIFIPIYKENIDTLSNLKISIENLLYPREKLQILILAEHDDFETIKNIKSIGFANAELIIVPKGEYKTKGNALNYGIQFITGGYLTIYDAEDVPAPDQLLTVVNEFRKYQNDQKIAAIQCKLRYYNYITKVSRLSFLDYEYIFNVRNVFMGKILKFFPIGGTSNHFKASVIKELNGWMAGNVTEDAEIACRMYSNGYKMTTCNSFTLEESVITKSAFIKQRSRWIKGYMQTFFSLIFNLITFNFTNLKNILISTIFMGISLYLPIFFFSVSLKVIFNELNFYLNKDAILTYSDNTNLLFLCFQMELVARFVIILKVYNIKGIAYGLKTLVQDALRFVILYFCSYTLALFEYLFSPHYWNKTHHIGRFEGIK